MSENNEVIYPTLGSEIITVENFMVIKEATMKCGDITVLVGEQATGKSLLAKLRYFFWDYQEGLWRSVLSYSLDGSKGEWFERYNEFKTRVFCELFSNIESMNGDFSISFQSNKISITIKRDKKNSKIKIEPPKGLEEFIKGVQDITNKNRQHDGSIRISGTELDFESMPSVLYVPASRLFFATIEGNPFEFFDSKVYSFDFLLRKFGAFWVNQKKDFSDEFKNPKRDKDWFKDASKVLAGSYTHRNDIDYIKTTWGETVELKDASSGQQEVLPLLSAIYAFPQKTEKNQLLIIEEPEAHIYPLSQRILIKMIAEVAREKDCKVMITTHSPYIPACVNNEILVAQNKNKAMTISAYHFYDGEAHGIYHEKQHVIDVDKLDEVSDQIADEYFDLTEKQDSAKKGNGKSGD